MTPAEFIDDPRWAERFEELRESARPRHLPAHEDCVTISPERAASHLVTGGTLGAMPGYEERPGQLDMLKAIVRAFNAREHLMIEAGTGVGKSLAYLIPAILWSHANDTTVVISTATRNLQGQLIGSDIPKALKVLGDEAANFKVAVLKGRANYLCLHAVSEFFAPGYWTMSEEEQSAMPGFIDWLEHTEDGDLDSYEGLPRSTLSCPGEECGGRRCPFYSRCFVNRARKRAADANLVIVNHALVLADATASGKLLPPHGRLIVDEAHNLEDIATEYLSREFSINALTRILNRLSRRGRGKRSGHGGVLAAIERQLQRGVLANSPTATTVATLAADAPKCIIAAMNAAEELADLAGELIRPAGKRGLCRYRVNGEKREHSLNHLFEPYAEGEWDEARLRLAQDRLENALAALVNLLHRLRDALEDSAPEGEFNYVGDLAIKAGGVADSLVSFANDTSFVLDGAKATHAYWAEKVRKDGHRPAYVRLVAAPLSVAAELNAALYSPIDSVILSSATLRVGNDFRYMSQRLGCAERFRFLTAKSPFDYFRQAMVMALDCLPDPSGEKYAEALSAMLGELFATTNGRALVLFTSYEMMNAVAREARDALAEIGLELLVQGEGVSREAMTRRLREGGRVVVFGAQSFWEGVDVAGEALSCVVLARLPFAQVGDPIVEARSEQIDRDGGSSFRDYLLPEAVIRFRQGFGRLIRTKADRGVVVVADPRLITKSYGAVFRKSIPATIHTVTGIPELLARTDEFFS